MSDTPERIWTCTHVGEYGHYFPEAVEAEGEYGGAAAEYVRRSDYDALAAKLVNAEAAIKRQAGAAKTLRIHTLAEVQHLKDMDRSEYNAAKTVASERAANEILTDQALALEAMLAEVEAQRDELLEATDYARNRLERLADDAWNIDGRDLKRNLKGVFSEYEAALATLKETKP